MNTLKRILLTLLSFIFVVQSYSQCEALGGLQGEITDPITGLTIEYTAVLSPTQSLQTFSALLNSCDIEFPQIPAPFSGLNGSAPNTITYSFSQPITSVGVIIAFIGVINSSLATEIFTFNTDTGIPTITVNSGSCQPMNVNGNVTDNIGIFGALNAIHTITSSTPFNSFTITTLSSGISLPGLNANGGSSYALCNNTLVAPCPLPEVNLGADTLLCNSETLLLDAAVSNGSYLWQDNSTQPAFLVGEPGTYFVQVSNSCGTVSDTILVEYNFTPSIDLGEDMLLCDANSFTLNVDSGENSLLWQDGSTNNSFIVTQSGIYWAELSNGCGSSSDSISVQLITSPTLKVDYSIDCDGLSVDFEINLNWNTSTPNQTGINFGDGSTSNFSNPNHTYSTNGNYTVNFSAISQEGCDASLNIPLILYPSPEAVINTSSVCSNFIDFSAVISTNNPNLTVDSQFWILFDDSIFTQNPSLEIVHPSGNYDGVFGITLSNLCAYNFPFNFFLNPAFDPNLVGLPNVITPNGDGLNDKFTIDEGFGDCVEFRIDFLNRWG